MVEIQGNDWKRKHIGINFLLTRKLKQVH